MLRLNLIIGCHRDGSGALVQMITYDNVSQKGSVIFFLWGYIKKKSLLTTPEIQYRITNALQRLIKKLLTKFGKRSVAGFTYVVLQELLISNIHNNEV